MTVYADDTAIPPGPVPARPRWSHLFADRKDELHQFAARLGLDSSRYRPGRPQDDGKPSPFWHYQLTAAQRQHAIRLGARPVTRHAAAEIIHQREHQAALSRLGAVLLKDIPAEGLSLREQTAARLAAAGITADDPALTVVARHNARIGIPARLRSGTASATGRAGDPRPGPGCPATEPSAPAPRHPVTACTAQDRPAKENDMAPQRPANDDMSRQIRCPAPSASEKRAAPAAACDPPGVPVPDDDQPVPYWPTAKAYACLKAQQ